MGKASRINHLCQSLEQDRDGWWWLRCTCRLRFGPFPDNDIAVDAYGDHLWNLAGGRIPIATQTGR